jgi:hypothetical protein
MLTLEGYRDAGGVQDALANRAEAIYTALSTDQQQIARRVLLRLTQPGEGTEDTRRRAARSELVRAGSPDNLEHVLGALIDARLLTTGRDETGGELVDVSHEALIRGCPGLRGWIDADRAGLLTRRRLSDAARVWENLDRDSGALYRGARLATATKWARDYDDDVSDLEQDFLSASQAAADDELQASRRRARRLKGLAGALAALTVTIAALALWALDQRRAEQQQTKKATMLALTSASNQMLNDQPNIALGLALRHTSSARSSRSREAL